MGIVENMWELSLVMLAEAEKPCRQPSYHKKETASITGTDDCVCQGLV